MVATRMEEKLALQHIVLEILGKSSENPVYLAVIDGERISTTHDLVSFPRELVPKLEYTKPDPDDPMHASPRNSATCTPCPSW